MVNGSFSETPVAADLLTGDPAFTNKFERGLGYFQVGGQLFDGKYVDWFSIHGAHLSGL